MLNNYLKSIHNLNIEYEKINYFLPITTLKNLLKDGRFTNRLTEYWASQIFNLSLPISQTSKYDLFFQDLKIGCRNITQSMNYINLSRSINIGGKRKTTKLEIIKYLEYLDYYIFSDITFKLNDSIIKYFIFPTKDLLKIIPQCQLSGIPKTILLDAVYNRFQSFENYFLAKDGKIYKK